MLQHTAAAPSTFARHSICRTDIAPGRHAPLGRMKRSFVLSGVPSGTASGDFQFLASGTVFNLMELPLLSGPLDAGVSARVSRPAKEWNCMRTPRFSDVQTALWTCQLSVLPRVRVYPSKSTGCAWQKCQTDLKICPTPIRIGRSDRDLS